MRIDFKTVRMVRRDRALDQILAIPRVPSLRYGATAIKVSVLEGVRLEVNLDLPLSSGYALFYYEVELHNIFWYPPMTARVQMSKRIESDVHRYAG